MFPEIEVTGAGAGPSDRVAGDVVDEDPDVVGQGLGAGGIGADGVAQHQVSGRPEAQDLKADAGALRIAVPRDQVAARPRVRSADRVSRGRC